MQSNTLTKEEKKLLADRAEWEKQYTSFLNRKNALAIKLQAASRTTEGSANYQKLRAECDKYHQLLKDTLPAYRAINKK